MQAEKELSAALKGSMPSALEVSTVQALEELEKKFNQTGVTYKESRHNDPPPQRVRENTVTPQRVTQMKTPSHSPPYEKKPERELVGENEKVVTSPPMPQMDSQPKPKSISNNNGNTTAENTSAKRRTLTHEVMLSCVELTDKPATPRQLALQKFPVKLFCEISGAVLDGETG